MSPRAPSEAVRGEPQPRGAGSMDAGKAAPEDSSAAQQEGIKIEAEAEEEAGPVDPEDEDALEEREQAEKKRNHEYMQWRRDFDAIKRKHEGILAESDKLKTQGNNFFSLGCYVQATMMYSEALELQPDSAVLLCNRSMAYLKQGMPEKALEDAER